jgi:uncharacterized membrane protein YphA (DoxX/SURF4 family)
MSKLFKEQFWDYFILIARLLLAWTLIRYGWGKLVDEQFGVTEATKNLPLKEVDLFRLSWYLADHEPFKSFVGLSQLLTGALLLYNRTVIFGAFMAIPIWLNILIWDMTFMGLYTPFTIRLTFYLLLTFLVLWNYRDKIRPALQNWVKGTSTKFKYPIWAYLLLPVLAIILELIGAVPNLIIQLFK